MPVNRNGVLGRDVKHRSWPRPWVLGCAALLLIGWLGLAGAIIEDSTSDIILAILIILGASWWWRRRTEKNLRRSGRSQTGRKGGLSRTIQGTYQPLLAVIWDLRNWI